MNRLFRPAAAAARVAPPACRRAGLVPVVLTVLVALASGVATVALAQPAAGAAAPATALPTVVATSRSGAAQSAWDGVVEAVRQTVVAAQVPGAVVELPVKVGDRVRAGQLLVRLDARAADQGTAASDAQVQAARAGLELATREFERQQALYQQRFISRAALDQAESAFKATQAQVNAQIAQAGAARTQTSFHLVRAPFAGVVADVPVQLGDMAMPGRPLLTLYDPSALRVGAAVPQSIAARLASATSSAAGSGRPARIELPGQPAAQQWLTPVRLQVLPTADAGTHTVTLRADLPPTAAGATAPVPGMFARLWLSLDAEKGATAGTSPTVPQSAVVRRAELTGLYVLDPQGRPVLRQVRLGPTQGDAVEVLSGLAAGERVVTDPQAAARVR